MPRFPYFLPSPFATATIQPDPAQKLLDLAQVARSARDAAGKTKAREKQTFRKRGWAAALLAAAAIGIGVTVAPVAMALVGVLVIIMPPEAGADMIDGGIRLLKTGLNKGGMIESVAVRAESELQSALATTDPAIISAIAASRYGNLALQGVPDIEPAFERAAGRAMLTPRGLRRAASQPKTAADVKPLTM